MFDKITASFLWLLWTLSALPLLVLLLEFRSDGIPACGPEGWYYARFYSHFFLYPVTFGLISTFCLMRPWVQSMRYLCISSRHKKAAIGIFMFVILAIVFIGSLEFGQSTPAVWEFEPKILSESDPGKKIRGIIEKRCNKDPGWMGIPKLNPCERREFKKWLDELVEWGDSKKNSRSYTEIFYKIGFIALAILFVILFLTVFILGASGGSEGNRMDLAGYALFFAVFWALMRTTFLIEKRVVYSDDPLLFANYAIFLAFLSLVYYSVEKTNRSNGRAYGRNIFPITLFASFVGIFATAGVSNELSRLLVRVFGTESSWETYAVVYVLLGIHFLPKFLENKMKRGEWGL